MKVEIKDEVFKTELKDGFVLYEIEHEQNIRRYKLSHIVSGQFEISNIDQRNDVLEYMIQMTERRIAETVRKAVFEFEDSNHNMKLDGMDIKISSECPEGTCIVCPQDFHRLVEKRQKMPFFQL